MLIRNCPKSRSLVAYLHRLGRAPQLNAVERDSLNPAKRCEEM